MLLVYHCPTICVLCCSDTDKTVPSSACVWDLLCGCGAKMGCHNNAASSWTTAGRNPDHWRTPWAGEPALAVTEQRAVECAATQKDKRKASPSCEQRIWNQEDLSLPGPGTPIPAPHMHLNLLFTRGSVLQPDNGHQHHTKGRANASPREAKHQWRFNTCPLRYLYDFSLWRFLSCAYPASTVTALSRHHLSAHTVCYIRAIAVWFDCWQLSIMINVKPLTQVCLVAKMLIRQKPAALKICAILCIETS